MNYLIQLCSGKAKKVISDCVINEDLQKGYDNALELLYEQFDKPYTVAKSYVEALKSTSMVKAESKSLNEFPNDMSRCEITLLQLGYTDDINNIETMKCIVNRLPYYLRAKWTDIAHEIEMVNR